MLYQYQPPTSTYEKRLSDALPPVALTKGPQQLEEMSIVYLFLASSTSTWTETYSGLVAFCIDVSFGQPIHSCHQFAFGSS